MDVIAQSAWDYTLFADEGRLLLEVVCGSVAIYTLAVELTQEERAEWEARGMDGLAGLVQTIRGDPARFMPRRVKV